MTTFILPFLDEKTPLVVATGPFRPNMLGFRLFGFRPPQVTVSETKKQPTI
jgi:hypothetical protein